MTPEQLTAKWQARAAEYRDVSASVAGAALCEQFVDDLELLQANGAGDSLTLQAAAEWSGFSARTLRRRIKDGTLRAAGQGDALRLSQHELPRKASAVAVRRGPSHLVGAKAEQVVRESVGASNGAPR